MTSSTGLGSPSREFTCVIRLANHYVATHVNGRAKRFISQHAETDLKVAQITAQLFSTTHAIPYESALIELDRPIITIIKNEGKWYPAELHPDRIKLLTGLPLLNFSSLDLGGNQQEATLLAYAIASSLATDCFPSIGIETSLEK